MTPSQHAKVLEALEALINDPGDDHIKSSTWDKAREALSIMRAEGVGEPQAIRWTLNGDKQCGYNNWLGETPFGRILITWKGWKENHDASVDEFPGDIPAIYGDPEGVKMLAGQEFYRRLALSAPSTEPEVKP